MRDIKFRMWNSCGESSRMFYSDSNRNPMACLIQQMDHNIGSKYGWNHESDGSAFMQFTGLKDRHGKDIYDGDIITNHDFESNLLIGFSSDKCAFVGSKTTSFNIEDIYNFFDDIVFEDKWEVIGNIYENPELLK